ncbi:haloacid dehalogenase superfamily, subfamily IA, variant 3 with third motif having DD or ED [Actinoalloteichus cyanogriseus DSM 43889]|uniref:Haloacid dehalogenase superfamily, subfamily IA, variant 3 with third motif having DD or ED n=2 Tax=Actinoalloteichus cyanogriseus TaxID=2893586 RepID=A0ABT1JMH6_ACTCY|nr:HAD-IA family hydrolase [Actinoalloteichus caeruleus]MCP2333726.1 haloacid dehalogenase superfamily, subfamily IA, variant 3 with third motif having DD or ED [Actinoalloteichus caeruleus DSM 43889]
MSSDSLVGLVMDVGGVLTDLGGFPASEEPPLLGAVRLLRRRGVRTAVLSNAQGYPPDAGWRADFDAVVVSGEVGMGKPDPRVYRLTAARLGLAPSRCVFVDDLPRNVRGAVAVGMVGVRHDTVAATLEELDALFPER